MQKLFQFQQLVEECHVPMKSFQELLLEAFRLHLKHEFYQVSVDSGPLSQGCTKQVLSKNCLPEYRSLKIIEMSSKTSDERR